MENYRNKLFVILLAGTMMWTMAVNAQTDCTGYITNPSFESDLTGWTHRGMGIQGNNVFSIKDGSLYVEKWTGRGGAVGDGRVSQELRNLPPGHYELTAAAQNIQEDTPTRAMTGARLFAGDAETAVTVRDTYSVAFTCVTGTVTIGFEAVGATGNWIAVDNFRLTLTGQDLTAELQAAIDAALALYGDGTGREAAQLLEAIDHARAKLADPDGEAQARAYTTLQAAVDRYCRANATADNPIDLTDHIVNSSFEQDGSAGWTVEGMAAQGNDVFSIKKGSTYLEKWTWRGNAVGDARVGQVVANLAPGRYRLSAAAQNIQEDIPRRAQSGAYVFAGNRRIAVTVRDVYTLEFVLSSDVVEIGFAAEGATGNWLAVDDFHLLYIGDDSDAVAARFDALIAEAELMLAARMNAQALQNLKSAIDLAHDLRDNHPDLMVDRVGAVSTVLETRMAEALASMDVFTRLVAAVAAAETVAQEYASRPSVVKEAEFAAAIASARGTYADPAATDSDAAVAAASLDDALFAFRVANGQGTPPTVVTDVRYVRGATWAFGRSTVNGNGIIEQGFCWSQHPEPTVTDSRTTEYLSQAGRIYWLRDLRPATIYYMRAYAINQDYAVGYGDVLKVITVPKGTIGHWYNNGGDEETNDRINYAIDTAMDYYWNNLTSIHGFGISVSYSPGTPTADCSYGGSMRVGANAAYQQVGTIMHEAFHGIGVGQHSMWWSSEMRSAGNRGDWLGDRVTEAVRFWDNSTTAVITGDDMHLWPYGCNGAQEDTHNDNLYCMMGILAQALNEDGLPGSGEIGYALPYYAFDHEDDVKYYIKNEDESRGLRTAYLVETNSHTLQWKTMSAEEAADDDAAAWYLTFTPTINIISCAMLPQAII